MEKIVRTLRVRVKTEKLTKFKKDRIRKITGRDTRIIEEYVKIIRKEEEKVIRKISKQGEIRLKVHKGKLDELTLTTTKKTNKKKRTVVPYDLKKKFPNCSHDEFQECRDVAVQLYEQGYNKKKNRKRKKGYILPPVKRTRKQLINKNRFIIEHLPKGKNTLSRWWVGIRDSLDTQKRKRRTHRRLWIPLEMSEYHQKEIRKGQVKSLELKYNSQKNSWWVNFQITIIPQADLYKKKKVDPSLLPPAVLGIDLGEKIPGAGVLLTSTGKISPNHIFFWKMKEWKKRKYIYQQKIRRLQRKLAKKKNTCKDKRSNKGYQTLKKLRKRYQTLSHAYLYAFINELWKDIVELTQDYNLVVVVGYPKGVHSKLRKKTKNNDYRPQNSSTRFTRKKVHPWNYYQIVTLLRRMCLLNGLEPERILTLQEYLTSSLCSKCGRKTIRPVRGLVYCSHCHYTPHSDLSGAINIGKLFLRFLFRPRASTLVDYLTGQHFSLTFYTSFRGLNQWLK